MTKNTYPLSQTQTGIYVTCMNNSEEGNYNVDILYKLDDSIDSGRLARALEDVIEAHPYVKSRLVTTDEGEVVFEDHSDEAYNVSVSEINDIEDVRPSFGKDFDLLNGPLFRLEIYKTGNGNYLYVDFHHIIFDGFSFAIFREDLANAYSGMAIEKESVSGFQISETECAERRSQAYDEAKAWYAKEFGGAGEVESMPLPDIYDNNKVHYVRELKSLDIDKKSLDALCGKTGVKESIVFTAAFSLTLSKFAAEDEVLYNTAYHGRTDKTTRRSFCMMVKTMPVYHNLADTPTVEDLLKHSSEQIETSRRNSIYSYGDISTELGVKSDISFVYQGTFHNLYITLDGKTHYGEEFVTNTPGIRFLNMILVENGVYYGWCEYQSNKYSKEFISGFWAAYEHVLNQMCIKDKLCDIEICNPEQLALLDSFNHPIPEIEGGTVLDAFRKAARQYPDNIAAVYCDRKYSYRELDELTDRIGAFIYSRIKDQGKKEPVVSILIPRNEYMFLLPLSAMKAGCAYQPLDPSYPQDRLNFMVKDADAALLITDREHQEIINEYEGETVLTENLSDTQEVELPSSPLTADSLFILLYTSGSTGVPKGVMLEHRNLMAFIHWYRHYYGLTPENKVAAYASFGFDANMMDMYPALTTGAAVHIIPENIRLDLVALNDYFETNGITHSLITTQVGVQFLQNTDNKSLKHLSVGGEKLVSIEPAAAYTLHNAYGPTECTIITTTFPVLKKEQNIPIGKPLDSLNCFIVDKNLHRLPVGASGELIIIGDQVGRGYLNRPEKTAEAFFISDGRRAYHSGDIVRYRQDGNIEFVGRKDGQVKIRGFRIELKEVEAVIRDYPGIADVTVQAYDDANGGKFIAAYIVSDNKVDISALNDFILDCKPPYMVPAVTMQIDRIPLNVNQKVDKKALPKPEVQKKQSGAAAPLNELEKEIKEIIAGIVKTEEFGVDDVLGFVGLTSISSIRLATLLFKRFGVRVDTKSLAKTATILSIEEQINAVSGDGEESKTYERYTEAPLTHSQQGVYAECVNNADSVLYNIPIAVRMPDNVTAGQLEKALRDFVSAHSFINSVFTTDAQGNAIQRQLSDLHFDIPVKQLSADEAAKEKQAFVRPFNLAEGPLFRFEIVSTPEIYLLADFHHLISDGASIDIFLNQLCSLLDGGKIEAEHYDYYNFARDQKISPETEAFFDRQLAVIEESSEILPDVYDSDGLHRRAELCVSTDLDAATRKCKKLGITPAALYLAATAVTVSKYVMEDTVGLCTISNGRTNSLITESLGMFVNTLPIVSSVASSVSVDDYLSTVSSTLSETIANEEYPFARIAEKYNFSAKIMYAYQVGVINQYRTSKGELTVDTLALDIAKFPVAVYVEGNEDDGGKIRLEYDTALYSKEMMEGFIGTVRKVAEELTVKDKVADIELCNPEQLALLDSFNHPFPEIADETVLEAFRKAARQYPDNIAAVYSDRKYSYRELDELTDRLGAFIYSRIKGQGKKEPVVSILIPRNEYMFILPLSAMKAGCAYQPLDPSYPQDRLNFMVKDADAALLITDREHQEIINEYEGETVLTENLSDTQEVELPSSPLTAESLFILLYTSGSTGVPKGVMLEHRNLMAFIHWYRRYYGLTPENKVAAYASFGFDANMMDMYPALTTGAAVHIIPEDIRLDLVALNDYYETNGITHSFITTQVGVQFLQNSGNKSLKHLSVGGEKLVSVEPSLNYSFHNVYGPTECTIFTTTYQVLKSEPNIPIGKPVDSLNCYVVDKNLQRLPVGASGELIIIGDQVGRGYLNRPEKTAEAFFVSDGRRAYHSGDIVRYRQDGNIEFVGRKDGQVKIRGFRIELKEVEAVIRDYPGIADVTVQAYDDANGGKFIAAYIVSDNKVDISALNDFILDRKPPYMVPAVTMQIDRIPLNVNQKVDKKALPKPEVQKKQSGAAAPLNELEKELKTIIAGVLKIEDFGIEDLLGYIGLTSISSIKLATLLYKKYGVQLNAKTLFKTGTLQSIENDILRMWMSHSLSETEVTEPVTGQKTECVPLSFAQQGIYTDCIANAGGVQYNMPEILHFPEGTGAEEVKKALEQVLAAHPYMTCHFVTSESGEVVQKPIEGFQVDIPVKTMTSKEFKELKQSFVRPFNLDRGPLFRWEIAVISDDESRNELVLLSDIHHLIGDGASLDLIYHQLCQALDGETVQKEAYDYYQFVQDQVLDVDADEYFDRTIGGVEEVSRLLPDIYDDNPGHHPRTVRAQFPKGNIQDECHKLGITPAAFFLAATALTVSRYLCEEDVSLITISNGRSNLKVSDTAGMFVNTLPLALHVGTEDTVSNLLQHAASVFSEAIEHESYPFARVASRYGFTPQISYACQLGVMEPIRTRGGEVTVESLELEIAKVPVAVSILGSLEDELTVSVEYDSSLYSETMARHFAESIANVASALSVKQNIKEISLTREKDWALLDTFNSPLFTDYDHDDTVVSLFRKQVKSHPDKTAAIYGEKRYSYRELDEVTDSLASVIYDKVSSITGKKKLNEEVVSIIIGRNEWVFLLPLAVLKTGCAYEPLDPSYPSDRLNYMVSDSHCRLLIGQSEFIGMVDEYSGDVLLTDELETSLDASAVTVAGSLFPAPAPKDLLLMLYTSGSTGKPKGVQIEHHSLVSFAHGISKSDFYAGDCVAAAYASFGFDVCMMDTFCTLLNGGTLVVIPEDMRLELGRLAEYMESEKVTQIFMTTQVGVQFLQNYPSVKHLRYLGMGGEKLPAVSPEGLSYKILNGYGPTENTCGVSLFPIMHWEPNIPLGRPFPTILGYIFDKSGHRLPPGACGEYCVAGDQPARGYLGLPEKSAEVFVEYNGLRMYHTGDIVRYRENGDVEFVGRKDGMVKIRGFRIELKEVEAAIRLFDDVEDVTVQAYDYESGGKYLAAFVVSHKKKIDIEALLAFVKSKKPPYMVPAIVMQIDSIPLTVNQKVDKKALPKPSLAAEAYVAPKNKVEKDFCTVFGEVLGQEKVSATSDFFEIGGSSIIALKVVIAAEKLGYSIVYKDVFSYTTAQSLAAHIVEASGQAKTEDAKPQQEENSAVYGRGTNEISPDGYDYREINALLRKNTLEAFKNSEAQPVGDVLLAGATGYLGIHVLKDLIDNFDGKIYCFVRNKGSVTPERRLIHLLYYYFEKDYSSLFESSGSAGARIFIVEGDATDPKALDGFEEREITVINCAACVKHFSRGNEIELINVGSVRNLIAWCIKSGSRLVHVSTGSVMGASVNNVPPKGFLFNESMLYVGQRTENNQYIHSKFMAERCIYEAILHHGLNAKVMRVGNLAPRDKDGEFQINFKTNNFMATLGAFGALGMIPYSDMDSRIEFSPIDKVARAIMLLASTPRDCVCFMPSNQHRTLLGDVVRQMGYLNKPIRMVESEEFVSEVRKALNDPAMTDKMRPFMAYAEGSSNDSVRPLGYDDLDVSYTDQILYRLGFHWPATSEDYVRRFLITVTGFNL